MDTDTKNSPDGKILNWFFDVLLGGFFGYVEETPKSIIGRLFKVFFGWPFIVAVWIVFILPFTALLVVIYWGGVIPYRYIIHGEKPK